MAQKIAEVGNITRRERKAMTPSARGRRRDENWFHPRAPAAWNGEAFRLRTRHGRKRRSSRSPSGAGLHSGAPRKPPAGGSSFRRREAGRQR